MKGKSTLFIVLSLAALALAVGGYFAVLWWVPVMGQETPPPASEVMQDGEFDRTPHFTAYGTVTAVGQNTIAVSVSAGGAAKSFSFAYNGKTEFYLFEYKDDDDLEGTKTPIKASDLKAGDRVAVYADEEIGSISPQTLTVVLKLK